jgi:hypothetical protein
VTLSGSSRRRIRISKRKRCDDDDDDDDPPQKLAILMKDSHIFVLKAFIVWAVICLPGNIVTLVLLLRQNSQVAGGELLVDSDISVNSVENATDLSIILHGDDVQQQELNVTAVSLNSKFCPIIN